MPDPQVEDLAQSFARVYQTLELPEDREEAKQFFADGVEQRRDKFSAFEVLLRTGDLINEDMTSLLNKAPSIPPLTREQAGTLADKAKQNTPWYRRAVAKAAAGADWWNRNVTEPSVATTLGIAAGAIPGEQPIERRIEKARQTLAADRQFGEKVSALDSFLEASTLAYRETTLPTGAKGVLELVIDPLNLIGLGIPGKAMSAVPALRPLLLPLHAIDRAPDFVVQKLISGTARTIKVVPGVKQLAAPSQTAQVKEVGRHVHETVSGAFSRAQIESGIPLDTKNVFNNLTRFPEDTGSYSLRNIMNHVANTFADNPKGIKLWENFNNKLQGMEPRQAVNFLTQFAEDIERKVIRKGGTRFSGEVIEGTIRQRRVKKISGVLENLAIDENISRGVAEGIDSQINLYWDKIWLKKVEPILIRPWSIANLAFAGFFPMNVVEDVTMGTVGMGGLGRRGMGDIEFKAVTSGLPVPSDLVNAGGQQRLLLDSGPNLYNAPVKKGKIRNLAENAVLWPVRLSSKVGFAIRRSAWTNKYYKEFDRALLESSVSTAEVQGIRDIVHGEFPESLNHLRDEIGAKVWSAATTGNPQHIRDLTDVLTSERIIQKAQMDIIIRHPDMPTDVRRVFQKTIADGGVTPTNVDEVTNRVRDELLDWHKFTAEGVRDQFDTMIRNLASRPPQSAVEAQGLLTSFQHAYDELTQLPREINAHARVRANLVDRVDRQEIYDEALDVITAEIDEGRTKLNALMVSSRPNIERLLVEQSPLRADAVRQSVDEIFTGYKDISDNLNETWINHRQRRREHFDSTPRNERGDAFWAELDVIGETTWAAEYEFRAGAANRVREGWNTLLDNVPANLSQKDREFLRRGLDANINDAADELNRLQVALLDAQEAVANSPSSLVPQFEARVRTLSDNIIIANRQKDKLTARLSELVDVRPPRVVLEELQIYDRNIGIATSALQDAQRSNLFDRVPGIQQDIDAFIVEREGIFQKLIPPELRPEWEALATDRDRLAQELQLAPGDPETISRLSQNNARITRFRNRIELGDATVEIDRITAINERSTTTMARTLLREGETPATMDAMISQVDALADAGDQTAINFRNSIDIPQTDFAEPDIVAQLAAEPIIFGRKTMTKTNSTSILERTLDEGGSTTNLLGEDMVPKAQAGETGRYFVGAFPDFETTILPGDVTAQAIQDWANTHLDLLRKKNHFMGTWVDEDGNLVLDIAVSVEDREAALRLSSHHNQTAIRDAVSGEDLVGDTVATPFTSGRDKVYEQLYSKMVELDAVAPLAPADRDLLRTAMLNDVYPTDTLDRLINAGFLEDPIRLTSGKMRTKITDAGKDVLATTAPERDIAAILDDLPAPVRQLDTLIDEKMGEVDEITEDLLKLWDNPPLRADQESDVSSYLGRVADDMDKRTAFNATVKDVRKIASERTNVEYNKWFTNYDDRSSFDYIMQRFMPFWMYESRRWPRLLSIAAKRPILAKNLALVGGDWDYGYSPTPFGFEFNPLKGTGAGAVRRTLARDFPEYNSGYRGKIEQTQDWFARGAFYFNPLITSSINLIQDEPGAIAPPPVTLILHSLAAAGVELPTPLRQLAFDSRYTQFMIDQIIADNLNKSPAEVRRLAEAGEEEAVGQLYLAEKEAAVRMITISQSSVLRYRPESKRDFIESANEAADRIVGIPADVMKDLQRLGISYYEITAVSGPQRRAMAESVPNFDAWIGASLALRPVKEQKMQRAIAGFWDTIEDRREENLLAKQENSDDWRDLKISGPAAVDELSALNRERGAIFNAVHALPEFNKVPISLEDRLAYLEEFGRPSPMVSPVDEALEQYYSISADDFLDQRTGDMDWGGFFDKRRDTIDSYDEPIRSILESEIRRSDTELERALDVYSPLLRQYFGIRSGVMEQIAQADPVIAEVYSEYRRTMNALQLATTEAETKSLTAHAREILAVHPQLAMAEAIVRQTRKRMREEDPNMERAYQLFIARPGSVPSPSLGSRTRRVRTGKFSRFNQFRRASEFR